MFSLQIPLLLLIDEVVCLKLEIHTWPSYLKSPVLSLYIARQSLRKKMDRSVPMLALKREILLSFSFSFTKQDHSMQ